MSLQIDVALPALEADAPAGTRRFEALPAARALTALLRRAARAALEHHGLVVAELSITLLDDDAMRDLNRDWLGHDRPTDVIAFPLEAPPAAAAAAAAAEATPLGDIYIGVERAIAQAAENDVPAREELVRLAVHGTLHVLGHDHPEAAGREQSEMWQLQEELVRRVTGAGA